MTNPNISQTSNFKFIMNQKTRNVEFHLNDFQGLGMTVQESEGQHYMGWKAKRPGDNITFNDLTIQVNMDSEFKALQECWDYMDKMAGILSENRELDWNYTFEGILLPTSNKNNFNKKITLQNCWIRDVADLQLNYTQTEATPIILPVTIAYDSYKMEDYIS